jgi:ferredoxin
LAYKIGDNCMTCGVCEGECSEGAIFLGPAHFQIDPAKCKDCGNCANVCPVGAPQL